MIDMLGSSMQKYNTGLPFFSLVGSCRIILFHAARQDPHKRARRVRLLSGAHMTDVRRRAALTRSRGGPYQKRVTRGIFAGCGGTVLSRRKNGQGYQQFQRLFCAPCRPNTV